MRILQLVVHQARYDLKSFWRDPASVFFTAVLPVIFLSVLVSVFGDERLDSGVRMSTYYVPGILALAVVSGTFVNLAMSLTTLREDGVLKRLRGTPLPPAAFIGGRIVAAFALTLTVAVALLTVGSAGFGVSLPGETWVGFVTALLVGAASFSCLGIAASGFIPTPSAASAVTNAIVLPLYFTSGIFFASENIPPVMSWVAGLFPVKHLAEALFTAFDPATDGAGIAVANLVVVAAWGAVGAVVAARSFRWAPQHSR